MHALRRPPTSRGGDSGLGKRQSKAGGGGAWGGASLLGPLILHLTWSATYNGKPPCVASVGQTPPHFFLAELAGGDIDATLCCYLLAFPSPRIPENDAITT